MYKFDSVKTMKINDMIVHVPNEPEKYLASIYTENWRVPDPNWKSELGPSWNELQNKFAIVEYME